MGRRGCRDPHQMSENEKAMQGNDSMGGGVKMSRTLKKFNRPGSRDLVRVYPVKQVEAIA